MSEMKWEKLTEIYGRLDADVMKSFLEAEGIPVELFQEAVGHHAFPTTVDGLGRVQLFVPKEKMAEMEALPHYPRVIVESSNIVIEYANGKRQIWGTQENHNQAVVFASALEKKLQAMRYISIIISDSLEKARKDLISFNLCNNRKTNDFFICKGAKPPGLFTLFRITSSWASYFFNLLLPISLRPHFKSIRFTNPE